jgi:hypothetical protein
MATNRQSAADMGPLRGMLTDALCEAHDRNGRQPQALVVRMWARWHPVWGSRPLAGAELLVGVGGDVNCDHPLDVFVFGWPGEGGDGVAERDAAVKSGPEVGRL